MLSFDLQTFPVNIYIAMFCVLDKNCEMFFSRFRKSQESTFLGIFGSHYPFNSIFSIFYVIVALSNLGG